MAVAAEQINQNYIEEVNHYDRIRNDTETWAAEALNGSMRTTFEYSFDGTELYAEDGGELGVIFDDAIEAAAQIVQDCPTLLFELRRRLIERGELTDMVRMARGELPNTMIVTSDYPPELMGVSDDVGGYNGSRKQTMLRIITLQNGKIRTITQSLDGSNRQALEAIYGSLNEVPKEGELLGQRIHKQLSQQDQDQLVDKSINVYDDSLAEQHGGYWHAGYRQPDARAHTNTYEFASDQTDLIDLFVKAKLAEPVAAERLRFKLAATMHERYENYLRGKSNVNMSPASLAVGSLYALQPNPHLYMEMEQATEKAVSRNMSFSGCGASVSAESLAEGQLSESGYGNKTTDKCEFISKSCPMCKAKNVKTKVTKTQISGSCGCSKKR